MHPGFKKYFEHLSPSNPLSSLAPEEQWAIFAILLMYGRLSESPDTKATLEKLEKSYQILDQVTSLADSLDSAIVAEIFPLDRLLGEWRLSTHLRKFASTLHLGLRLMAKRRSQFNPITGADLLVLASEIVERLTGGYADEHVAELFQVMPVQVADPDTSALKDLSGDAIRKRRNRFIRDYPREYRRALRQTSRFVETAEKPSGEANSLLLDGWLLVVNADTRCGRVGADTDPLKDGVDELFLLDPLFAAAVRAEKPESDASARPGCHALIQFPQGFLRLVCRAD